MNYCFFLVGAKGDDGSGSGGGYQGVRASPSGGGDRAPGADQPAVRPVQAAAGNGADAALLHLPGHRPDCGQAVWGDRQASSYFFIWRLLIKLNKIKKIHKNKKISLLYLYF